jgi:hypothetical protein
MSLDTMTVHTANFTLCYLGLYSLPGNSVIEQSRYIGGLIISYMVKLKHANIGFTTIDTGVIG